MSRKEIYRLNGMVLNVDDGSYLIEVRANHGGATHKVEDLPAWIFESRYAIWLTEGTAPIRVRAMEGEQIKQTLLTRTALRNGTI